MKKGFAGGCYFLFFFCGVFEFLIISKEDSSGELIRTIRERVSQVLITIDRYPEPSVPKIALYQSLPQHEFLTAAHLLVDESFDKDLLFWKYIDEEKGSIKLNLRPLFQAIQFVDIDHKDLNLGISHLRDLLASKVDTSLPSFLRGWIGKDHEKYLILKEELIPHRFEFFVYQKMVQHIKSNKLSLKHSIKYKKVEDELYEPKKWRREKRTLLKKLDYLKLLVPIRKTLATKEKDLGNLYTLVNRAVLDGSNPFVTVTTNKKGQKIWKLTPYEPVSDNGVVGPSLIGVLCPFLTKRTLRPRNPRREPSSR